jgi:STE24 endopeptidase
MRTRIGFLPMVGFCLFAASITAQEPDAATAGGELERAAGTIHEVPAEPADEETAREPFDIEAATTAYLSRQTPEEKARSDAYFEGGYWLQLWGFLYGLGVAWLLLGTGLSARMRDLAERLTRRLPLQTAFYTAQYIVLTTLLFFPLTVYQGFIREHKYDLATQAFPAWLRDQAVDLGVSVVLLSLLFMVLYGVFRRAPRTWWLWGSGVGVAFLVFVILIGPVYIDPLFNTYTPLEDEAIEGPILSMARANGIETENVYQFDASRQTTRISANVSGFMNTMSIRLNDNLLERCSLAEIKAVMAHEMGHYALNHIYESIIFLGLVLVGGFAFIRWSFDWARHRWGGSWAVRGIGDVAGLPLLAALFSVYFFVLTPVLNTYIRVNEVEADLFGLHAAGEPDGFAEVALKLGEYRKLDPGPVEEWIFYDHPSGRARIHMAMTWKAEHPRE